MLFICVYSCMQFYLFCFVFILFLLCYVCVCVCFVTAAYKKFVFLVISYYFVRPTVEFQFLITFVILFCFTDVCLYVLWFCCCLVSNLTLNFQFCFALLCLSCFICICNLCFLCLWFQCLIVSIYIYIYMRLLLLLRFLIVLFDLYRCVMLAIYN